MQAVFFFPATGATGVTKGGNFLNLDLGVGLSDMLDLFGRCWTCLESQPSGNLPWSVTKTLWSVTNILGAVAACAPDDIVAAAAFSAPLAKSLIHEGVVEELLCRCKAFS